MAATHCAVASARRRPCWPRLEAVLADGRSGLTLRALLASRVPLPAAAPRTSVPACCARSRTFTAAALCTATSARRT